MGKMMKVVRIAQRKKSWKKLEAMEWEGSVLLCNVEGKRIHSDSQLSPGVD